MFQLAMRNNKKRSKLLLPPVVQACRKVARLGYEEHVYFVCRENGTIILLLFFLCANFLIIEVAFELRGCYSYKNQSASVSRNNYCNNYLG